MLTPSRNARLFLRNAEREELLYIRLKRSPIVLVRMPQPGQLHLELDTKYPAILSAALDGNEVLPKTDGLQPGRHTFHPQMLSFAPADVETIPQLAEPVEKPAAIDEEAAFLATLGVEPDLAPRQFRPLYIGPEGGRLEVWISYVVDDNGVLHPDRDHVDDEIVYKINGTRAYELAIADNAHRLDLRDSEAPPVQHFCGLCQLHEHDEAIGG